MSGTTRWAAVILVMTGCGLGKTPIPPILTFNPDSLRALDDFLRAEVDSGSFPGGVLLIGHASATIHTTAFGHYGINDPRPVTDSTVYDLASLTKVVGLTSAVWLLLRDERIDLDTPVVSYLPEFSQPDKRAITLRHLVTHTSGLPGWVPLYQETASATAALRSIYTTPLEASPGRRYEYSDLGAIVMTQVIERVTQRRFDDFLADRVFVPLGMSDTYFNPDSSLWSRIAPTEIDSWRQRELRGEVHDENAYHLGGVSGHAGLFSTVHDLARFARWLLDAYYDRLPEEAPTLTSNEVRRWTARQPGPEESTRAIGWDTPTPGGGASSGHYLSSESFGHTGFTGTSIWIDPTRGIFVVLLTNRVHPTRENRRLPRLRGVIMDKVVEAIQSDGGQNVH